MTLVSDDNPSPSAVFTICDTGVCFLMRLSAGYRHNLAFWLPFNPPAAGERFKTPHSSLIIRSLRPICARKSPISEADMAVGRVKFFNDQRGFAFITPDDGTEDVLVHKNADASAGMNTLSEGQRVNYEVIVVRGKTAASDLSTA